MQIFGAGQYAMRLWVKPDQLAKLGITVPDIITAVQKQNTVNPAGQIGGEPIPSGQNSLMPCAPRDDCKHRRNLGRLSLGRTRTVHLCGSKTSRALIWARKLTT